MNKRAYPTLTPRLVVPDSAEAIAFYCEVFGAEEVERYRDPTIGRIVHAMIRIGGDELTMTDENLEHDQRSPRSLGGSAVLLHLEVDDPDAVAARAAERGSEILIPIGDRFYGRREGRIADPWGHLWIVGKQIEELEPDEINRRIAGFHDGPSTKNT